MAQRFDAVLFGNPDSAGLPPTQYDRRNITSTRYVEVGTNKLDEGADVPASTPPPSITLSLSELLGFYSYDPSRSQRIITIGVESYSIRRSQVVTPDVYEPLALVCPQIQQYMDARYLSLLVSDFGQGLANTGLGVTLTENQAPAIIKFQVGKLSPDVEDSTLYHPNAMGITNLPPQKVRSFTVRVFVRATYEPNAIPVAGTMQGGPPMSIVSRMNLAEDPYSRAFGGGGGLPSAPGGGAPGSRDDGGRGGGGGGGGEGGGGGTTQATPPSGVLGPTSPFRFQPSTVSSQPRIDSGAARVEGISHGAQAVAEMVGAAGGAGLGDEPPADGEVDRLEADVLTSAQDRVDIFSERARLRRRVGFIPDPTLEEGDEEDEDEEVVDDGGAGSVAARRRPPSRVRSVLDEDEDDEEVVDDGRGSSGGAGAGEASASGVVWGPGGGGGAAGNPGGSQVDRVTDTTKRQLILLGRVNHPVTGTNVIRSTNDDRIKDILFFERVMTGDIPPTTRPPYAQASPYLSDFIKIIVEKFEKEKLQFPLSLANNKRFFDSLDEAHVAVNLSGSGKLKPSNIERKLSEKADKLVEFYKKKLPKVK